MPESTKKLTSVTSQGLRCSSKDNPFFTGKLFLLHIIQAAVMLAKKTKKKKHIWWDKFRVYWFFFYTWFFGGQSAQISAFLLTLFIYKKHIYQLNTGNKLKIWRLLIITNGDSPNQTLTWDICSVSPNILNWLHLLSLAEHPNACINVSVSIQISQKQTWWWNQICTSLTSIW